MQKIGELFARDIRRKIEEVIKVDQSDEDTVLNELTEYVATDAIKENLRTVYKAVADAPSEPHEGIGVWVSGFFGSGKSSFAKILGYTIGARQVRGRSASQIFKENLDDDNIGNLLDFINKRIPTHAVIFDVSMDRGVRTASERITEIMYKALLRELNYAEDFDLAELEITLEKDGRLEAFRAQFEKMYGKPWESRRKIGLAVNEASATLNALDSKTFTSADSWAKSLGQGRADITPNLLAERAFDLAQTRKSGHVLIFVIDEVGQYVARSVEKMLDLQAIVQAFGIAGKNKVKAKQAPAPCWIVVTSQEKLNEVVDSLEGKKVELARLQDRFPITIDLKQSDISEVTGKRVLEKNSSAKKLLGELYERNEGRLRTFCSLENTSRSDSLGKLEFASLYPYLPYQIDLCIDIVAGLRLKRGAQRHIGGSNRTIIKQAQQMLVHPRTNLSDAPIGTLVTLDRVYELLYLGNLLPVETTREVDEVPKYVPENEMATRVAKAIALLEAVTKLPRTAQNLAVVLHPAVEADSQIDKVKRALEELEKAQVIKESEEGYKLLTVEEKNWDTERSGIEAKPSDRDRILKEILAEIFRDPRIKSIRYKNLRTFKIALLMDGDEVEGDGHIPIDILPADDSDERSARWQEARRISNERKNEILWVAGLSDEIHRAVEQLHRSREMVSRYERDHALGKLSADRSSCLSDEKARRDRFHQELRRKVTDVLKTGTLFFRGIQKDGTSLGQNLGEVVLAALNFAIPDLYPKLEMGIRQLKGDEPEKFLTAANLNGLPPVFYEGETGLSLVAKQSGKFVPNITAPVCREVLDYLRREHSYGNKVTGKSLETHFQGIGYGWERDILRLVLAVLLRGGAIEVTHQGRKYRNHNEPACREPFVKDSAFRSASFAPREALDLKILTDAARSYEDITGKEVDIEESAIAQAVQRLAVEDREQLRPLIARMKALRLPGFDHLVEHLQTVEGVLDMPADDCVKTLAGEGKSYKEARVRLARFAEATNEKNVELLQTARRVIETQWPALKNRSRNGELEQKADELAQSISSPTFYETIDAIRSDTRTLSRAFQALYTTVHEERSAKYASALEFVKGLPEWLVLSEDPSISDSQREVILRQLQLRAEPSLDLPEGAEACLTCRATLDQMESDILALDAIQRKVVLRVQELAAPEQKIAYVRLSSFIGGRIEKPEDIDAALERLKAHLMKLLAEGVSIVLE